MKRPIKIDLSSGETKIRINHELQTIQIYDFSNDTVVIDFNEWQEMKKLISKELKSK